MHLLNCNWVPSFYAVVHLSSSWDCIHSHDAFHLTCLLLCSCVPFQGSLTEGWSRSALHFLLSCVCLCLILTLDAAFRCSASASEIHISIITSFISLQDLTIHYPSIQSCMIFVFLLKNIHLCKNRGHTFEISLIIKRILKCCGDSQLQFLIVI